MKIKIITVGKQHTNMYFPAITTFEDRLAKHVRMTWDYIPSSNIDTESGQILKRSNGYVILLDETGTQKTSIEIADKINTLKNNAVKDVTLIIGGAYGVSEEVIKKADFVWSLSNLVFPHQLVRLILVEQLYRAFDILANGKYHHG